MILRRVNTVELLGVYISPNMDVSLLLPRLTQGLANRPDLAPDFSSILDLLNVVQTLKTQVVDKLTAIVAVKIEIINLERAFQTALRVYNIGSALAMKVMDLKPVTSGSPLATGAEAALEPLKAAVDDGLNLLRAQEDLLNDYTDQLTAMADTYKTKAKEASESLMNKLAELGGQNIEV